MRVRRSAPEKISEADVMRVILDYCAARRIFVRRRNVGAFAGEHNGKRRFVRFGKAGESDLWGIGANGRHWECEIKAPGREPSDAQNDWLNLCAASGAVAWWADSLERFIEGIERVI